MPLLSTPSEKRSLTSVLLAENACEENPVLASVVVFSALRSSTFMRVLALALPFAWTPARAVANSRDCLPTETGRVEVKGAPPAPQTLAPPRYVELPVPASRAEVRPSSLSALRLVALPAVALTLSGGLPEATFRPRAVAPDAVLWFTRCRAGLAMEAVSLLTAPAEFALPRMKLPPVAPSPAVATPTTSASMIASPTTVEVALAIHKSFLSALLIMPSSFRSGAGEEHPPPLLAIAA